MEFDFVDLLPENIIENEETIQENKQPSNVFKSSSLKAKYGSDEKDLKDLLEGWNLGDLYNFFSGKLFF